MAASPDRPSCIDVARRRQRRSIEVEITEINAPALDDALGAVDDREFVNRVLGRLDVPGRAIVVLHYYLGLPLTEVAATLGIPLGTVKSRLHRALREMRVAISDDELGLSAPVGEGQLT